jgi:hypothetical protein
VVSRAGPILAPMRQYGWWWTLLLVTVLVAAPIAATIVLNHVDTTSLTRVIGSVSAFLATGAAMLGAGVKWADRALSKIQKAEMHIRGRVDTEVNRQAAEMATKQQAINDLDRQLAEARSARDGAAAEIVVLNEQLKDLKPSKLLAQFLEERSSSSDYRRHLGVTALIRRDFEELSRLVAENNKAEVDDNSAEDASDTNFNRVVLYVDDLDRCPPPWRPLNSGSLSARVCGTHLGCVGDSVCTPLPVALDVSGGDSHLAGIFVRQ